MFSRDEDLRIVAPVGEGVMIGDILPEFDRELTGRIPVEVLRSRISSSNFCRGGVEYMSIEFSFSLPSMKPRDLSASGFLSAGFWALFETSRSASFVGDFSSAVLDLLFVEKGGMACLGSFLISALFSDAVKAFSDPPDVLILLRFSRVFSRTCRSVLGMSSLVTNSILLFWLLTIEDQCKTHNYGLYQLPMTVSCDLSALHGTLDSVLVSLQLCRKQSFRQG